MIDKEKCFLDQDTREISKEAVELVLKLIRGVRKRVYEILYISDKKEIDKKKREIRKILFELGKIQLIIMYHSSILKLENGNDKREDWYLYIENKSLDFIIDLEFREYKKRK